MRPLKVAIEKGTFFRHILHSRNGSRGKEEKIAKQSSSFSTSLLPGSAFLRPTAEWYSRTIALHPISRKPQRGTTKQVNTNIHLDMRVHLRYKSSFHRHPRESHYFEKYLSFQSTPSATQVIGDLLPQQNSQQTSDKVTLRTWHFNVI